MRLPGHTARSIRLWVIAVTLAAAALGGGCLGEPARPAYYREPGRDLVRQDEKAVEPVALTQWWLKERLEGPDESMTTRIEDTTTTPLLEMLQGATTVGEADVVRLTLAHNLAIQISDTDRERAVANVAARKGGVYDLVAALSVSEVGGDHPQFGQVSGQTTSSSGTTSTSGTTGAATTLSSAEPLRDPTIVSRTQTQSAEASLSQRVPTGGTLQLFANENRQDFDRLPSSGTNPFTDDEAGIRFTQPLLRGFGPTVTNSPITIARLDRGIAEWAFRDEIANQLATVLKTYYNLTFALESAAVQRLTLLQSLDLEAINKIRQRVGDLAQVEVEQATADVARQEEQYLIDIQAVLDRQDELRRLMNLPQSGPLGWDTPLLPSTVPTYTDIDVAEEELLATAFENRSDWRQALLQIEKSDVNLRVANNNLLPRLDASVGYSYVGENGDAERSRELAEENDYEQYSASLELEYPLQNREARYDRYRSRLAREAAELRLQDLSLTITQEIRRNLRELQTARKRIDVTLAAIRAEQAKYDSERKRFEVGLSTSFELLDALDDLSNAKVSHLDAIVDFRTALIDLKIAQGTLLGDLGISIGAESSLESTTSNFLDGAEPPADSRAIQPEETLLGRLSADETAAGMNTDDAAGMPDAPATDMTSPADGTAPTE